MISHCGEETRDKASGVALFGSPNRDKLPHLERVALWSLWQDSLSNNQCTELSRSSFQARVHSKFLFLHKKECVSSNS